jgi:hypothetical protein
MLVAQSVDIAINLISKAEFTVRRGLSIFAVVVGNRAHVWRFRLVKFVPPGQIVLVRFGIRECRLRSTIKHWGGRNG